MAVCSHHFVYFGVVNLAYRDQIIGAIDVWRCDKCHAVDALPKRMGSLEQTNPMGFNAIHPSWGRWILLTCFFNDDVKFELLPVERAQTIHHECLEGVTAEWEVQDDYSLGSPEGASANHRSYLVERFVGHTIELTAEHPLVYGTVLIAYCTYKPLLQRLALGIRGRLRSLTGVSLTEIEAKEGRLSFLIPIYARLPNYTVRLKDAITDLSRYDFIILCFARQAQAFSLVNSYVKLLRHPNGKSFAVVVYGKEFEADGRIDALTNTLRAMGGETAFVSTITAQPSKFQDLKQQIDDLCLRLRSVLATSV